MRLDAHVHTLYSGPSSIRPLGAFMRESYNTPEAVYRRAKARGMDLVAITDHDRIDGAITIAHRPDVIVGCEVTAAFPRDGVKVHLNVLDITEAQFLEIDRRRHDVTDLLPYLKWERVFVSLNHVASRVNGRITARHVAALVPWIDGFEVINGSRLATQNRTAARLARAHRKVQVAGSDAHTLRGIGRTWIDAPHATSRAEFMTELHAGRVTTGGRQGSYFTMASDILRVASNLYREEAGALARRPFALRRQAAAAMLLVSVPFISVPLAVAAAHFVLERRFNRSLLHDLAQQPDLRVPELA